MNSEFFGLLYIDMIVYLSYNAQRKRRRIYEKCCNHILQPPKGEQL